MGVEVCYPAFRSPDIFDFAFFFWSFGPLVLWSYRLIYWINLGLPERFLVNVTRDKTKEKEYGKGDTCDFCCDVG